MTSSDAAQTAGHILQLMEVGAGGALRAELGRVASFAGRVSADWCEDERWDLLQAIAQAPDPAASPAAVALLRHLAAGRASERTPTGYTQ